MFWGGVFCYPSPALEAEQQLLRAQFLNTLSFKVSVFVVCFLLNKISVSSKAEFLFDSDFFFVYNR